MISAGAAAIYVAWYWFLQGVILGEVIFPAVLGNLVLVGLALWLAWRMIVPSIKRICFEWGWVSYFKFADEIEVDLLSFLHSNPEMPCGEAARHLEETATANRVRTVRLGKD